MWTEDKQRRLDNLRERADAGTITEPERQLLQGLLDEIFQDESTYLESSLGRLRAERLRLEEECARATGDKRALADLVRRQADVLARAKAQLAELVAEHERIVREAELTLGHQLISS